MSDHRQNLVPQNHQSHGNISYLGPTQLWKPLLGREIHRGHFQKVLNHRNPLFIYWTLSEGSESQEFFIYLLVCLFVYLFVFQMPLKTQNSGT